jgi:hypothetical protein
MLGASGTLTAHVNDVVPVAIEPTGIDGSKDMSPLLSPGIGHSETDLLSKPSPLFRSHVDEWTSELQHRFHELAIKEAMGELPSAEAIELEHLSDLRRTLDNPRTGDEVLWEYKQRRLTRNLLGSLKQYVEFYEGPSPAWTPASKDSNR